MPHTTSNPISAAINKPIATLLIGVALAYCGTIAKDSIVLTSRVAALEEQANEYRHNGISRDEFNRLDREVQLRATREEVQAISKRLDDMRSDIADIKRAVVRSSYYPPRSH